jgi:archaellum component FlaC
MAKNEEEEITLEDLELKLEMLDDVCKEAFEDVYEKLLESLNRQTAVAGGFKKILEDLKRRVKSLEDQVKVYNGRLK